MIDRLVKIFLHHFKVLKLILLSLRQNLLSMLCSILLPLSSIINLCGGDFFHASSSAKWSNVLILAKLFSLLATNGKLECTFSLLNVIKDKKCTCLTNESPDDLLSLLSNKIALKDFNPDQSIDLWWSTKKRRLTQKERKQDKPCGSDQPSTSAQVHESDSEPQDTLKYWDEMMNSDEESSSDSETIDSGS